jgi:hypothetical protein
MTSSAVCETGQTALTTELIKKLPPEARVALANLLAEVIEPPVSITTFIDHPAYLNLEGIIWPQVRQDLIDFYGSGKRYRLAYFDEGIGAGKSMKVSCIFAYEVYKLMCLENPQKKYKLAPGSIIALINMAPTAPQARSVVFSEVKNRIAGCAWFKEHGITPDPHVTSELRFPKNIRIFPGNSSMTFPLGYNLFAGVVDEASFYDETDRANVAEEIHTSLSRRITSRFGMNGGPLVSITSPRYVDDFVENEIEAAKGRKDVFVRRRATWEGKPYAEGYPRFAQTHPVSGEQVMIPIEFEEDFKKNPDKAWRDFGAVPSLALEPFFRDKDLLKACFVNQELGPDPWQMDYDTQYAIHVDLAKTRDACGLAVGRLDGDGVSIECAVQLVSKVQKATRRFPDAVECGNSEVDFEAVRGYILALRDAGFPIISVSYDGWQSVDSQQLLTKEGLPVQEISVDRGTEAYDTLKELMYSSRLRLPVSKVLKMELERLEMVNGKKVDHPPKGSKDVSDSVAGVCYALLGGQLKGKVVEESTVYQEEILGDERDEAMPRIGVDW